jgi:hypothetical protein
MKIFESSLKNIVREEIRNLLSEAAPEIASLKPNKQGKCVEEYDLSVEGVKVYFTLPQAYTKKDFNKNIIMSRDIVRNLFNKGIFSTSTVIHAGIVFSDRTTLEPISFIQNNQTINPYQTVVLLINGTTKAQEDLIRKKAEELIQYHKNAKTKKTYNTAGILAKIPVVGQMLAKIRPRQINTFYCSQLISYMLGITNIVSLEELDKAKSLQENDQLEQEVYNRDALSPSELYDMIKNKSDVLPTKCKEQEEQEAGFDDLMNL